MKLLPQWHVCRVVEPAYYVNYLVHNREGSLGVDF